MSSYFHKRKVSSGQFAVTQTKL